MQFDGIEEEDQPNYSKHLGTALEHIVRMIVLEFEFDDYTAGEASQQFMCYALFVMALMMIIIVLLNLLIAMMTDIFTQSYENMDYEILKAKLDFIISHWDFRKRTDRKYLVVAN